ncbi:MAG TPA: ABC transporter ATP-binding protein [Patescibacteria group bacterium]|nr:ABC transporter ATP-binding protein [Patescibacteria group bacterium]
MSTSAPTFSQPTRPGQPLAIDVRGIRRVYAIKPKPVVALDGVDLQVEPGEFFGLLGPNGAGKTTLIKILTTLLLPSAGTAWIFGFDVERQTKQIRRIMNMVAGGEQSGYGILTVREQLWMFSQFYGLPSRDGWNRVDELIDAVGLDEQREQRVSTLSTGQRQKMNFARGLLNDPWIFFLDEPTLGLDVAAARSVRELVVAWKAAVPGRTVLLTTHYMAEADELCDRIAIVDHGRILALGSPGELKKRVQRESVFRLELDRLDGGPAELRRLPGVVSAALAADHEADGRGDRQTVEVNLSLVDDAALGGVVGALGGLGAHILALRKSEPSLEDVFVELVGRGFGDESSDDEGAGKDRDGGRGGDGDGTDPDVTDPTGDAREREIEAVG